MPVGSLPRARCLHIGALLAGLPSPRNHDRALHRGALLTVEMLRITKSQTRQVITRDRHLACRAVRQDPHPLLLDVHAGDLPSGAVLHPALPLGTVLRDERHPVTLTQPIGDLGEIDLLLAEFAALCA